MRISGEENSAIEHQRFRAWPVESTFQISDWNGVTIEAAQSRGHVVAVADFSNNMMRSTKPRWPTAGWFKSSVAILVTQVPFVAQHSSCFAEN